MNRRLLTLTQLAEARNRNNEGGLQNLEVTSPQLEQMVLRSTTATYYSSKRYQGTVVLNMRNPPLSHSDRIASFVPGGFISINDDFNDEMM
jgi:hypothetical protein